MATHQIPVILHGVTGRMGDVAHRALKHIISAGGAQVGSDSFMPVPIGVGRSMDKLAAYAEASRLEKICTSPAQAVEQARQINPVFQVYHNAVATGARLNMVEDVLPLLNPATTGVFCEKPVAANYAEGRVVVEALERGRFSHGVVHDMLETPGIRKALELIPRIKPLHCSMVFGYEVGDGFSDNSDFRGQRPDFNWRFSEAGGGIILDMCHEAYVSHALFGATDRVSAVARLLVPERASATGNETIRCDVEDYVSIRREHASGVVNTSVWTWMRRVNSEFGPLEITVEGRDGTVVFGLHGLKLQWRESAPAVLWKESLAGKKIAWRDYWEYPEFESRNPFAVELERFIRCLVLREPYPYSATVALDWLGEVEAIYESAAAHGAPCTHDRFLHYPDRAPADWTPERLQVLYGASGS